MKRQLLILFLLLLLTNSYAKDEPLYTHNIAPRLAVIISINGIETYEFEGLKHTLSDQGLKKIFDNGAYEPAAQCNYIASDATTFYASLMCGTFPAEHGIIGNRYYSKIDNGIRSIIEDARYDGINSSLSVSPRLLQATTIGDELKLYNPNSKVFAVAINAESAIMLGGHLADGAIWFDDETKLFATSNFYNNGLPLWASQINENNIISTLTDTIWKPAMPLRSYRYPSVTISPLDINPTFAKRENGIKNTPHINKLIRHAAIEAIKSEQLGRDSHPDILAIEFAMYKPKDGSYLCAESEDMFASLDRDIQLLLNELELSIGLENVVIVLTAPHSENRELSQINKTKLSQGIFSTDRATALLNAYLMAIYGQGRWVIGCWNKNIYLNRSLIEEKELKINDVEDEVALFMMDFAGVKSAYPAHSMHTQNNALYDFTSRLFNSHYRSRSGNVVFTLQSGWIEEYKKQQFPQTPQGQCPIIIWRKGTKFISPTIDLEDICPTLCRMLYIPLPKSSTGKTLKYQ